MEEDEETKLRHNVEDAFSEAVEALHELAETLEAVNWQWEAGVTLQEAAAEAAKCNPGAGAITKLADDGILGVSVANICKAIKAANEYNAQQYPDYAGALAAEGAEATFRLVAINETTYDIHTLTHAPNTPAVRQAITRECVELMCLAYEHYRWFGEVEP